MPKVKTLSEMREILETSSADLLKVNEIWDPIYSRDLQSLKEEWSREVKAGRMDPDDVLAKLGDEKAAELLETLQSILTLLFECDPKLDKRLAPTEQYDLALKNLIELLPNLPGEISSKLSWPYLVYNR